MDSFYKDDQSHYTSGAVPNFQINRITNIFKKLKKIKRKFNNTLEIGGFDGDFLKKFKKYTKKSYLVEPNKQGAQLAKRNGITNIYNGFLDDVYTKKNSNFFDLIICRHVIEHVLNPQKLVDQISNMLKDGGILVLETPDLNSIIRYGGTGSIVVHHLNYFSKNSLEQMTKKSFLKIASIHSKSDTATTLFLRKKKFNAKRIKKKKKKLKNFININKINKFKKKMSERKSMLNKIIAISKKRKVRNWIYGASSSCSELFTMYNLEQNSFSGIIDSDKSKKSLILLSCPNLKISYYSDIKNIKNDTIFITTRSSRIVEKFLIKQKHAGIIVSVFDGKILNQKL